MKFKLFVLAIIAVCIMSPQFVFAQGADKTITLVVSGEGTSKEEATKSALRSAIEQAFGTFVSANTEVLNDELVKDEIVTISSGNVQSYEEVSYIDHDDSKEVTLKAVVSIGKLISYAQNKGMSAELAGATFLMNKRMRDLNEKNELLARYHLWKQVCKTLAYGIFDYEISVGDPREIDNDEFDVPITVKVDLNQNGVDLIEAVRKTLISLSLTDAEVEEYKSANRDFYPSYVRDGNGKWRCCRVDSKGYMDDLNSLFHCAMCEGFEIDDNVGNRMVHKMSHPITGASGSNSNSKLYVPFDWWSWKYIGEKYQRHPYGFEKWFFSNEKWKNLYREIYPEGLLSYFLPDHKIELKYHYEKEGRIRYNSKELEQLNKIEINPIHSEWHISRRLELKVPTLSVQSKFENVNDKNLLTYVWFEGYFNFSMWHEKEKELVIYNGAQSAKTRYKEHGRVAKFSIKDTESGDVVYKGKLKDTPEPQIINFISDATHYRFIVESIYEGSRNEGCAIAEIVDNNKRFPSDQSFWTKLYPLLK